LKKNQNFTNFYVFLQFGVVFAYRMVDRYCLNVYLSAYISNIISIVDLSLLLITKILILTKINLQNY